MHITHPELEKYILNAMPERDDVLKEMEELARQKGFPIIGPMCGTFLRQLALITGARNIFEMGSGFGYSAYWFAGGLKDAGKIICTDGSEKNKNRAMQYLKRGGFDGMVEFYVGYAQEIIKQFDGPFDIILNDVDKEQYPEVFDLAVSRLKKGGIFITDNVLWGGDILDENPDEQSRGILEFNRKLFSSGDILSSIIPIRDGLGMAVKL
ncbi:MAG: O-methyltransferase [Candidatus Zixiibacteriota bacterium]|nr:MAG: O-methyltransferase [candidate division Zixibacteria bacterium]